MKQISPILYSPYFNQFLVSLKEKQHKNTLTYDILFNKHNTLDIHEYVNKESTCQYMNTPENHSLVQHFKETSVFQRIESVIHSFEEKMKNQLQIKNATFEGKDEKNHYILSCDVVNPLFKGDFSYYQIEPLETNSLEVVDNQKIRIILDSENSQYLNNENHHKGHFTHRSFVQDIADLIVKDPRVRVRMLVN